jgi:hypothetical protein
MRQTEVKLHRFKCPECQSVWELPVPDKLPCPILSFCRVCRPPFTLTADHIFRVVADIECSCDIIKE